jgi:hypothetical protein
VDVQDHVGGVISNGGIRVSGQIIQQLIRGGLRFSVALVCSVAMSLSGIKTVGSTALA